MKEMGSGRSTVQRSKFYVHIYEMAAGEGEEEIKQVLKEHRRMYKKANHHCWACRYVGQEGRDGKNGGEVEKGKDRPMGKGNNGLVEKGKDDGEVGHPGKVLLEVLRKNDMEQHLIVVSRIFGGVKLGVGGVSRAFKAAAEETLHTIL
ncbi:MAG: YigZ family protein [Thermoplasmata archaeon]|nr:YigZ family protein [Thermoplasmata archaeon]